MATTWKSYVMAPLGRITDWDAFRTQLLTLRRQGVVWSLGEAGELAFVDERGIRNDEYARDFLRWYQGSLERHMARVMDRAHGRLDPVFSGRLGVKIAGIHWQHDNPLTPRAAEHAAGYHDYASLMDRLRCCDVDLTFTCLEMDDSDSHRWPVFSAPQTLVRVLPA